MAEKKRYRFYITRFIDVIAENEEQAQGIFYESPYSDLRIRDLKIDGCLEFDEIGSDEDDCGAVTFSKNNGVITKTGGKEYK